MNHPRHHTLVALLILLILLVGCMPQTAAPGETQGGKTPIVMWTFGGEDFFVAQLEEGFEAQHPDLDLQVTLIPEDQYVTKIDTALAADSPPDIGFVYDPRWLKAGEFLPLDDLIAEEGLNLEDFNQSALSANAFYEGGTYCLGTYSGAVMLFYNKDLFDAAGLAYPSSTVPLSIDQYATLAGQLTQPSEEITETVWGGSADATLWWMDWRNFFSEDGRTAAGYINDESTIHTHDVLASMMQEGHAPSSADMDLIGDTYLLGEGRQAMQIVDNVVAVPQLEEAGVRWGAAPAPVEQEGDQAWVSAWTDCFGVFAQSTQPDAAMQFIAFMATEGNRMQVEMADNLPLDNAVAEELNWAGDSEGRQQVLDVVALARPGIFVPSFWDVTAPVWDTFDLIAQGEITGQEGFDEIAPIVQDNLDTAWETWESIQ